MASASEDTGDVCSDKYRRSPTRTVYPDPGCSRLALSAPPTPIFSLCINVHYPWLSSWMTVAESLLFLSELKSLGENKFSCYVPSHSLSGLGQNGWELKFHRCPRPVHRDEGHGVFSSGSHGPRQRRNRTVCIFPPALSDAQVLLPRDWGQAPRGSWAPCFSFKCRAQRDDPAVPRAEARSRSLAITPQYAGPSAPLVVVRVLNQQAQQGSLSLWTLNIFIQTQLWSPRDHNPVSLAFIICRLAIIIVPALVLM